jgi:hypothetical protein
MTAVVENRYTLGKACDLPVHLVDEKGYDEWPWAETDPPPPSPPTKLLWERWEASRNASSCDLSHWQLMTIYISQNTQHFTIHRTTKLVPHYEGAICFAILSNNRSEVSRLLFWEVTTEAILMLGINELKIPEQIRWGNNVGRYPLDFFRPLAVQRNFMSQGARDIKIRK